jgi:hypothetical protein
LRCEKSRRGLGAGDDVLGFRGEPEFAEVIGDLGGTSRRVVRYEQDAGVDRRKGLNRAEGRLDPAKKRAVEVA